MRGNTKPLDIHHLFETVEPAPTRHYLAHDDE